MPLNPPKEETKKDKALQTYIRSEHWLSQRAPQLAILLGGIIIGAILNGL
jgi:hypothetical protein